MFVGCSLLKVPLSANIKKLVGPQYGERSVAVENFEFLSEIQSEWIETLQRTLWYEKVKEMPREEILYVKSTLVYANQETVEIKDGVIQIFKKSLRDTRKLIIPASLEVDNIYEWLDDETDLDIELEEVIFKDGHTSISANAFGKCKYIQRVVIPESVNEISDKTVKALKKATIVGNKGPEAEAFAVRNGLAFEAGS